MNKAEIIEFVAEKSGLTKADAARALDALRDAFAVSVEKKDPLMWAGVISMTVNKRAARNGRNPQTGAVIKIPETWVVKIKAGKELKDAVKN